jgi:hypothetical protein
MERRTGSERSVKLAAKHAIGKKCPKSEGVERNTEAVTRCLATTELKRRPGLIVEHARAGSSQKSTDWNVGGSKRRAACRPAIQEACSCMRVIGALLDLAMVRQVASAHAAVHTR